MARHRNSSKLYPPINPYRVGTLEVSPLHEIYFEESGNPDGFPVLFIHGGPGGATSPRHRRFFDPSCYRIILTDQRGCGKSTPHASLSANTTWDLVADLERLRAHLHIDSWIIFGGSWGSTLALAYAQEFPGRVSAMILRGIFLLRSSEITWFYQSGANYLFPDEWDIFAANIAPSERQDIVRAYYSLLTSDDKDTQLKAARAWCIWEKVTSYLRKKPREVEHVLSDNQYALAFARIECHYCVNRGFFVPETQILDRIDRIRMIKTMIIQGRYDIVCPMVTAWELHKRWPEAEFKIVDAAGHSAFEVPVVSALVAATDALRSSANF